MYYFSIYKAPRLHILGFPGGSAGKEPACNVGDLGSIPGLGRSPGEGKVYPIQYPGLKNSMNSIVHGVTKSRTRLSDFHFHFQLLSNTTLLSSRKWQSHKNTVKSFLKAKFQCCFSFTLGFIVLWISQAKDKNASTSQLECLSPWSGHRSEDVSYSHYGHQLPLKPCDRDFHKEGFSAEITAHTCPGRLCPVLFYYDLHFMCLYHRPLFGQTNYNIWPAWRENIYSDQRRTFDIVERFR